MRSLVPEARVAIAHGQMDEGSLETVVLDFWERRYDVLVCTTIIESGIDMPSVNTLIVDRADLLGLGQLHQIRGRVGRGGQRAYAYLFHPADRVLSEQAYERLRTIGEHTELGSGFKIAMRDLEIRGSGNLLGADQSGHIAAVGYDLYVQLVAEAVAEARGDARPTPPTVALDVPGRRPPPQGLRHRRGRPVGGLPATGVGVVGRRRRGHRRGVGRPLRAPARPRRRAARPGPPAHGGDGSGDPRDHHEQRASGRLRPAGGPGVPGPPRRQRRGPPAPAGPRGPVPRGPGPASRSRSVRASFRPTSLRQLLEELIPPRPAHPMTQGHPDSL